MSGPLLSIVVLSLALVAISGCNDEGCDLNSYTRDLGGVGLMDCGIARDDPDSVDSCAVTAHASGSTFRALYEDGEGGLEAIVHAAGGTYHLVRVAAGEKRIRMADCDDAEVVDSAGRTHVQCVGTGPFAVVCEP